MALTLVHQTKAEFAAKLKNKWQAASKDEKGKLAAWIYDHYQAGDFTAAQLRNAFDMDAAQFTAFVTRLQTLRDHWLAIQAEGPE